MQSGNTELTLSDVLEEHRRSRPNETAVVDGSHRFTYAELASRVDALAVALNKAGFAKGDRVAWLGQNSFRLLEVFMVASRIGGIVCPVNWRSSDDEVNFVLRDLNPSVILWSTSGGPTPPSVDGNSVCDGRWILTDGESSEYEHMVRSPVSPTGIAQSGQPEDSLVVMYTAAFEGRPNGALLTNRGMHAAGMLHGVMNGVFEERPIFLASGPMFHIATLMGVVSTFLLGGTNVFLPKVDVEEISRLIEAEGCTWAYLTGPTLPELARHNESAGHDFSSLFVPKAYVEADQRWATMGRPSQAPWSLHPGAFGQTEANGILTYRAFAVNGQGLAGRPGPYCQIRIVDADGREVAPGEPGEITARGPLLGNGYWNRPEINAERWRHGWWFTNDLGRREDDGSVTFIGPKSKMIKSAKENIYPAEVERCLLSHPEIKEVGVIGVPDEHWEQSVKAIVVLSPGASLSADQVIAFCSGQIASYKKPRSVEFVDSLPRSGMALDRDELDRRFGGGGYVGVGGEA